MQQVFIVTRRFNCHEGLGVSHETSEGRKYTYFPYKLNNLLYFWAQQFNENLNSLYDEYSSEINEKLNCLQVLTKLQTDENLQELFERLNNASPTYSIKKTEYLCDIKELLVDNQPQNIFVYHHWLDKQGFNPNAKKEFLTALREDVQSCVSGRDTAFKFNWLIHDSDLLNDAYNEIFLFNGKILHPDVLQDVKKEGEYKAHIPDALKNDNIWCFVHEKDRIGYYQDIILDFYNHEWNAEALYEELAMDKTGCKRRLEMLQKLGLKDTDLMDTEALQFVLERNSSRIEKDIIVSDLRSKYLE